jgi:hypothetical protein
MRFLAFIIVLLFPFVGASSASTKVRRILKKEKAALVSYCPAVHQLGSKEAVQACKQFSEERAQQVQEWITAKSELEECLVKLGCDSSNDESCRNEILEKCKTN